MGLTGIQTAIKLKEVNPKANVTVIDRFSWSLGASTRNAGFACFANISEILDDLQHDTPQNVYSLIANRYKGLKNLREKFGDKNIGYIEKGSVEIFTPQNKDKLHKCIDSIQAINTILYNEIGLDNVFCYASNNSLPNTVGCISNQYEGQLNTGMLYKTVYDYALGIGVKLFGGLEVTSWEGSKKISVQTKEGVSMSTSNLIICTNAFTNTLIKQDISPARGQVIVTEKVDKLPCKGLHMYDNGYYYWRDIDNRILLGGARNLEVVEETSYNFSQNTKITAELKRFMGTQIFEKEVPIEYEWSGIMAMGVEKEKTPIVKEIEPNIYLAVRLGGMGVALSANVANEVSKLV